MEFEWDEGKRRSNAVKHGIDFEEAAEIFDGRAEITLESSMEAEPRWLTIGQQRDVTIAVVWTRRGERIRIISARRARKKEIAWLDEEQARRDQQQAAVDI